MDCPTISRSLSEMSQAWPSDNTAGFFEGAEKLLEIWFKFSPTSGGLKLISR